MGKHTTSHQEVATMQVQSLEYREPQQPTIALALGGIEVGGRVGGYSAVVSDGTTTLHVSRLDGESTWTLDAEFRGSLPVFANGFGARYLRTRQLADEALVAQLNAQRLAQAASTLVHTGKVTA